MHHIVYFDPPKSNPIPALPLSAKDRIFETSQKLGYNLMYWGMRVSFLKAATKIIPPYAQRPLDYKILPQHRRKRWLFMELISYGAVLR
jgi:hypothetical protein